jgi:hypothetical protein
LNGCRLGHCRPPIHTCRSVVACIEADQLADRLTAS